MNYDYNDIPRNPLGFGLFSLFCGVVGTVILFAFSDMALISVILGAIGMVAGGFTMSHANHFPTNDRLKYMGLAGAGILTSVMSFMFGIAAWA